MKIVFPVTVIVIITAGCLGKTNDTEDPRSPVNLSHALSLVDSMEINGENIVYIWIYADAPTYHPIGANSEGITCVDDVGRFMEVLESEILDYNNNDLISVMDGMIRFLLFMSIKDGLWYNFMLADGSINTWHRNSEADFAWWAVRGLRGLAAAYNYLVNTNGNEQLLQQVESRIRTADSHLQDVLQSYPTQELTNLGMKPTWLIKNAPDMNSELLIALTKLHKTGKFDYQDEIEKISEGLIAYQYQNPGHDLHGMYLCWDNIWHNWGNNQAFGLLNAYQITGDSTLLASVETWATSFLPFLIEKSFPREIKVNFNYEYSMIDSPQIAYGINSIYRGIKLLADITGNNKYKELSESVFHWYKGDNIAQFEMYQSESGRCFDGIDAPTTINLNSGAESTIECLLSIQARGYYN